MDSLNTFFNSHGIDPFWAGLILGIILCAMARIGLHSRHESRLQGPVDSGAWTNARTEVRVANHAIPDAEGKAMLAALEQGNPERAAEILAASTGMDSTQATQVVATIQAQRHR